MDIQIIEISKLKRAEYNPRKKLTPEDPEYQQLKKSIVEFGYVVPVVVNFDMTVIGGHQGLTILEELGYKKIECSVQNLNKTQEKALNIALNKIDGIWDNNKLEALLVELKEADIDMDMTGFSFDEVDNILRDITGSKEDDFDVDQALNEIEEPVTKVGDIWLLGKHRLMCGDSTSKENVEKLIKKEQVNLILTDPPYNVDYSSKNKMLNYSDKGNRIQVPIENDNRNDVEFYNFLLKSFRNMFEVAKYGCSIYIFHADTEGLNFRTAFKSVGFKLAQCLIWVKNNFVIGRQDYQWKHEPILYGWKEGKAHYFIDSRSQNTVLEFDKPTRNAEHPTMKPIDLLVYLIKNSSKENDLILDLFGGSGSTLIAAEQTERTCYMMELDPKYCDVIIKRWENLTGKKAILEK